MLAVATMAEWLAVKILIKRAMFHLCGSNLCGGNFFQALFDGNQMLMLFIKYNYTVSKMFNTRNDSMYLPKVNHCICKLHVFVWRLCGCTFRTDQSATPPDSKSVT